MGSDLIQHMIEKAHTGVDLAAAFAIQPHLHVDLRLFGITLNVREAVAFGQLLANRRPAQGVTVIAQARNAHVSSQFDVGSAIANHVAVGFIQRRFGQILLDQLHFRLTAVAIISG